MPPDNDLAPGLPVIPPEWQDSVRYPRSVSGTEALQHLLGLTGVPDLQQAGNALARGEPLQALGQGVIGAAQLAGMAAPAGNLLRAGLRATPGVLADTTGAIRAWHGTPHLFAPEEGAPLGRFKDEAIGSGEGAQAYGWGHYVAGNQGVAKNYLPIPGEDIPFVTFEGNELKGSNPVELQVKKLMSQWTAGDFPGLYDFMQNYAKDWPEERDLTEKAISYITKNEDKLGIGYKKSEAGNLLEVHVLPEEHELLDWDKPLQQQEPGVQEALRSLAIQHGNSTRGIPLKSLFSGSGEEIYRNLARKLHLDSYPDTTSATLRNEAGASQALHEAGIPGIKYLDAGSRGQSDNPTHNYVIFHPSNLRIIGRNGERLEPVDHDPFAKPSK